MVEGMGLGSVRPEEMGDLLSTGSQELGDESPVAPLPGRLGAHEARGRLPKRFGQGGLPGVAAHPRGVAAEGWCVYAGEVVLARLAAPSAAEPDCVPIG